MRCCRRRMWLRRSSTGARCATAESVALDLRPAEEQVDGAVVGIGVTQNTQPRAERRIEAQVDRAGQEVQVALDRLTLPDRDQRLQVGALDRGPDVNPFEQRNVGELGAVHQSPEDVILRLQLLPLQSGKVEKAA